MSTNITVSVIIATYNSTKTLPMVLEALKNQNYPKEKMEIIIVDGGSEDDTLTISRRYKCVIIDNPRTEPVYGKFIGYRKARGKYLMYLDHDEVLKNTRSISIKVSILDANRDVKAIAGGNYVNPPNYPFINNYINEFGDPFSYFVYRLSKRHKYFLNSMRKSYPSVYENRDYILFDLESAQYLPIIELAAGASMFDAEILRKYFPVTNSHFELVPHFFYLLFTLKKHVAVLKNDKIFHYSSDTLRNYLKKINWRIKNNIFFTEDMGRSGFSGREKYQPTSFRLRKYLFIPYSISLVLPFWDAIKLVYTRKDVRYIIHIILCLYTGFSIIYFYILSVLGYKPLLKNYDNSKTVIH